jgi:NAD(P)-dependent dehydrogenase (short-subunit alcohol dehydrogenase family)
MVSLVSRAEDYLKKKNAWDLDPPKKAPDTRPDMNELAALRTELSKTAGTAMILQTQHDHRTLAFANRKDVSVISQQGPATPDHVIRTKQLPMLGRDIEKYTSAYKSYFEQYSKHSKVPMTMLDPSPRIILDPEFGLCTVGRSAKDAMINNELYLHTMDIIQRSTKLESFQALPAQDLFEVEYWDLEQAKLRKGGKPPVFTGEVALVTGAASGIGKACVEALLTKGAAVVGIDLNPDVVTLHERIDYRGFVCDVTDEQMLAEVLQETVLAYGGLDMLILNAGIFPGGANIADMDMQEWRMVLEVNLTSGLQLLHLAYPLLKLAPNNGRVVIIGSKNVAAPGPGASAYSASKAALNQLMRIAALEWGADGIRINTLHPDAVFDTGIWTPQVIAARAKSYNMTIDEYKQRNVMKVEITSRDVAALAAEMCGPLFAKTTAAQLPVDGGDARVI